MFVTTLASLTARTEVNLVTADDSPDEVSIQLVNGDESGFSQLVLSLPPDDDQALLLLDLLDAAVDNAVSAVRVRQHRREVN